MARCKDCIHEVVCDALIEKGLPWNEEAYPAEALCMAFQNKADVAPRAEVAREIFEEIGKILYKHTNIAIKEKSVTCELTIDYIGEDIAELKKKYI